MIEKLLREYKLLLEERKKALLELDGYKVKSTFQKEFQVLKDLEGTSRNCFSLLSQLGFLADEVCSLHEKVVKLTFSVIKALGEGIKDEHILYV